MDEFKTPVMQKKRKKKEMDGEIYIRKILEV
jgi:hypothetical protein